VLVKDPKDTSSLFVVMPMRIWFCYSK
jgi:hypothetical protein